MAKFRERETGKREGKKERERERRGTRRNTTYMKEGKNKKAASLLHLV